MTRTQVLAIASEVYPLIKTGGLADVTGALPGALRAEGFAVRTLVPGYPAVMKAIRRAETVSVFEDLHGAHGRLLAGRAAGLDLFVLDAPHLYARPGGPYDDPGGDPWPDNGIRFGALARAGAELGLGRVAAFAPAVVHAHDWQAALAAAYLHYQDRPRPGTVVTVHNLAFQGRFDRDLLDPLGLPPASFTIDGVEYYGGLGFLKAGLRWADRITTVSPTYAAEICAPEFGMGMDGLLRARADRLSGILNGIDVEVWNPSTDPVIAARFDAADPAPRAANKTDIQVRFGLDLDPDALLFVVISRLSWQKGLDLLLRVLPTLLSEGAPLALLGSGDADLEAGFAAAAATNPGRIGCRFGYDEALAHRLQAGADALLAPSRFEPCGLTQLCALRYGAVPVVARVGGLNDTVIDAGPMAMTAGVATGVQFAPVVEPMLESAIRRTAALYRDRPAWRRVQGNGLACDVSWRQSGRRYADLYRALTTEGTREHRRPLA